MSRARVAKWGAGLLVWLVLAALIGLALFLSSSRVISLAGHDAEIQPGFSGQAQLDTGPVLPDLKLDIAGPVGVDITLGKTEAATLGELTARYGALAAAPEGQIAKVRDTVISMAVSAGLRGAVISALIVLAALGLWRLVGQGRIRAATRRARDAIGTRRRLAWVVPTALVTTAAVVLALWQPWTIEDDRVPTGQWMALSDFLGEGVNVPSELDHVEVRGDVTTNQTRRLVESAIDTYDKSHGFYQDAVDEVPELEIRKPDDDETLTVFVSDRHDNIGMDKVVKAVAEEAGATSIFNAGDDTSTGSSWEDFSLDSIADAAADLDDRWFAPGNHDHGDFMASYLSKRDWTMLEDEVIEGPGGGTLYGIPDPRSSGLGAWRGPGGTMTFSEAEELVAESTCAADTEGERVNTILVHDANLGREALSRGCADLVLGGHVHVASGPDLVKGANGKEGYTYTLGTTGGAAYAIALGKPRRVAQVGLVTYGDDGRPQGIQVVKLETNGRLHVDEFMPLTYSDTE